MLEKTKVDPGRRVSFFSTRGADQGGGEAVSRAHFRVGLVAKEVFAFRSIGWGGGSAVLVMLVSADRQLNNFQ